MVLLCYQFTAFCLVTLPIEFRVTCDHGDKWLIRLVLKDTKREKMRAKYNFIYQGT